MKKNTLFDVEFCDWLAFNHRKTYGRLRQEFYESDFYLTLKQTEELA